MNTEFKNLPYGDFSFVAPADPFQAKAVAMAKNGSFVLQGPPGTGKSHTVSLIIAEALLRGEKALLVSEKQDALDVVYGELDGWGLGDFLYNYPSSPQLIAQKLKKAFSSQTQKNNYFFEREKFLSDLKSLGALSSFYEEKRCNGKNFIENLNISLSEGEDSCLFFGGNILSFGEEEFRAAEEDIMLLYSLKKPFGIEGGYLPLRSKEECIAVCRRLSHSVMALRGCISSLCALGAEIGEITTEKLKVFLGGNFSRGKIYSVFSDIPAERAELLYLAGFSSAGAVVLAECRERAKEFFVAEKRFFSCFDGQKKRNPFLYLPVADGFILNGDKFGEYSRFEALRRSLFERGISVYDSFFSLTEERALFSFRRAAAKSIVEGERSAHFECGREALLSRARKEEENTRLACRREIFSRCAKRLKNMRRSPFFSRRYREALGALYGKGKEIPRLFYSAAQVVFSSVEEAKKLCGRTKFNLIIFDEASRTSSIDAYPLFSLAERRIISGDEKQLPPASFFSPEGERENILSACLKGDYPQIFLSAHYRSRREGLIAFSNSRFYDGKLITFPSAFSGSGIEIIRVDGVYESKKGNINIAECDAVIDGVCKIKKDSAYAGKSIGIITLSLSQRRLIEKRLAERFIKEKLRLEGVVVRNIENIQGEEKDIIFLSVCYGKDENGRFSLRLGALSPRGGERRLNVALTRAKEKMFVFHSLPDKFFYSDIKSRGAAALRDFLLYAEEKEIPPAAREWQRAVGERFFKAGLSVFYNVGKSSFKIPVAVKGACGDWAAVFLSRGRAYEELLLDGVLSKNGWKSYFIAPLSLALSPQEEIDKIISGFKKKKEEGIFTYEKTSGWENAI